MKRIHSMKRYFGILAITMFASVTACSYVVDMVERSITKRASFSVNATYDSVAHTVTITWDESGGGNFAGYEVYVTSDPDDEYSGYEIIAGRSDMGSNISGSSYFDTNPNNLDSIGTRSYTFPAVSLQTLLISDGVAIGRTARYFFRLGIIAWDEDTSDRPSKYIGGVSWETGSNLFDNYKIHTDIDEISGLAAVDITRW